MASPIHSESSAEMTMTSNNLKPSEALALHLQMEKCLCGSLLAFSMEHLDESSRGLGLRCSNMNIVSILKSLSVGPGPIRKIITAGADFT